MFGDERECRCIFSDINICFLVFVNAVPSHGPSCRRFLIFFVAPFRRAGRTDGRTDASGVCLSVRVVSRSPPRFVARDAHAPPLQPLEPRAHGKDEPRPHRVVLRDDAANEASGDRRDPWASPPTHAWGDGARKGHQDDDWWEHDDQGQCWGGDGHEQSGGRGWERRGNGGQGWQGWNSSADEPRKRSRDGQRKRGLMGAKPPQPTNVSKRANQPPTPGEPNRPVP